MHMEYTIMMKLCNVSVGFEDYITFPKKGDIVTLVSKTEKIEAEVDSCPFDLKRAVAKIYFSYTNHTSLVIDMVDKKGRMISLCKRNCDSFLSEEIPSSGTIASYFIFTPTISNHEIHLLQNELEIASDGQIYGDYNDDNENGIKTFITEYDDIDDVFENNIINGSSITSDGYEPFLSGQETVTDEYIDDENGAIINTKTGEIVVTSKNNDEDNIQNDISLKFVNSQINDKKISKKRKEKIIEKIDNKQNINNLSQQQIENKAKKQQNDMKKRQLKTKLIGSLSETIADHYISNTQPFKKINDKDLLKRLIKNSSKSLNNNEDESSSDDKRIELDDISYEIAKKRISLFLKSPKILQFDVKQSFQYQQPQANNQLQEKQQQKQKNVNISTVDNNNSGESTLKIEKKKSRKRKEIYEAERFTKEIEDNAGNTEEDQQILQNTPIHIRENLKKGKQRRASAPRIYS